MAFDPDDREAFLEIWRSLFPPSYTSPIETEANGQGLDVYSQQAAQFARASEAVVVSTQALFIRHHSSEVRPPASGAVYATGEVLVTRAAPALGAITLDTSVALVVRGQDSTGQILDGVIFTVAVETTIPGGSSTPVTVPVVATRPGFQGNVPVGSITAFLERGQATIRGTVSAGNVVRDDGAPDRWSPKMIGQYVRITSGPDAGTTPRRVVSVTEQPTSYAVLDGATLAIGAATIEVEEFAELGLTVTQPAATEGGRHGELDAAGRDRDTPRAPGELDEAYRERLSAIADVVSPNAITRTAARALTPLGLPFVLEETRDGNGLRGFVWDYDPFDFGGIGVGRDGGSAVLLSQEDSVRYFILRVGISDEGEFGFAFDATSAGLSNAWDAPGDAANFFDGYPVDYYAQIAAVAQAIQAAKMGGVRWSLVRDPTL